MDNRIQAGAVEHGLLLQTVAESIRETPPSNTPKLVKNNVISAKVKTSLLGDSWLQNKCTQNKCTQRSFGSATGYKFTALTEGS